MARCACVNCYLLLSHPPCSSEEEPSSTCCVYIRCRNAAPHLLKDNSIPTDSQLYKHTNGIRRCFIIILRDYQGAQLILHCGSALHETTSTSSIPQASRARHVVVAAEAKELIRVQIALIANLP